MRKVESVSFFVCRSVCFVLEDKIRHSGGMCGVLVAWKQLHAYVALKCRQSSEMANEKNVAPAS